MVGAKFDKNPAGGGGTCTTTVLRLSEKGVGVTSSGAKIKQPGRGI